MVYNFRGVPKTRQDSTMREIIFRIVCVLGLCLGILFQIYIGKIILIHQDYLIVTGSILSPMLILVAIRLLIIR